MWTPLFQGGAVEASEKSQGGSRREVQDVPGNMGRDNAYKGIVYRKNEKYYF